MRLDTSPFAVFWAAQMLIGGGLVAFPTETVYGLGVDATNSRAIKALYAAKRRPTSNPLIVHVASLADAEELVEFDKPSMTLAETFWPGPLTLVLPARSVSPVSPEVSAGRSTLAVRFPSNPLAIDLIKDAKVPVAAPSANLSGRVSPTTANHVLADLDGKLDAVIDGGDCVLGLESTVIHSRSGNLELLRPGTITAEIIQQHTGLTLQKSKEISKLRSPGQLPIHYSPRANVRAGARAARRGEVLLGFGPNSPPADFNLSRSGDLNEAAANFYRLLREADELVSSKGAHTIAVSRIPESGVGIAINDRLRRAAANPDSGTATT